MASDPDVIDLEQTLDARAAQRGHLRQLQLYDLLLLVEAEGEQAIHVVEKIHDWEHQRRSELSKWLFATAAALAIGITSLLARTPPPSQILIDLLAALIGLALAGGIYTYLWANSVAKRLARSIVLVRRMLEIRPFLTRLKAAGKL